MSGDDDPRTSIPYLQYAAAYHADLNPPALIHNANRWVCGERGIPMFTGPVLDAWPPPVDVPFVGYHGHFVDMAATAMRAPPDRQLAVFQAAITQHLRDEEQACRNYLNNSAPTDG